MNGAQSLIRTLVNCGVDVCFGNPGTECLGARQRRDGIWLVNHHRDTPCDSAHAAGFPVLFFALHPSPHVDMRIDCRWKDGKASA
jgi:hypothetical protein